MRNRIVAAIFLVSCFLFAVLFGTLSVGAEEVDPVIWKVNGTNGENQFETLQAAMKAAEQTSWEDDQSLIIEVETESEAVSLGADGALFDVEALVTPNGNKLPITISGGVVLEFASETFDDVLFTNEYTFSGVEFSLVDVEMNFLLAVDTLTFENVTMGSVGFGAARGQHNASIVLTNTYTEDVALYDSFTGLLSLAVKGESVVTNLLGGGSEFSGELAVSLSERAQVLEEISLTTGAQGSITLSVADTARAETVTAKGNVAATVSGGTVTMFSNNGTNTVTGGTITRFYGGKSNAVSGGTIAEFYGTARGAQADKVENTVTGGTVPLFYGTGENASVNTVINTVTGGSIDAYHGAFGGVVALANEVAGTSAITTYYGSGNGTCGTVSTTVKGNAAVTHFYGAGGYADTLTNSLSERTATIGTFYGSGDANVGAVFNNVTAGTISGNFYGVKGPADSVTNTFGVQGKHIIVGDSKHGDIFCKIDGTVYGTNTGKVGSVTNHLYTNIFSKTDATTLAKACFYGTGSGVVDRVVNNFVAEVQGANQVFAGTSNAAGAEVTESVINTNNGGTGHFNAYALYPIGVGISGELENRFIYTNARTMPRIVTPDTSTTVKSVNSIFRNILRFTGSVELGYTVQGDVVSEVSTNTTYIHSSHLRITGTVGGNVTNKISDMIFYSGGHARGVYAAVSGNVVNEITNVSVVDASTDKNNGFHLAAGRVGGTVTNTLTNFYCATGTPLCGATASVGQDLPANYSGIAVSTTMIRNGKVKVSEDGVRANIKAGIEPAIKTDFYGSGANVNGTVRSSLENCIVEGMFAGVHSTLGASNVPNYTVSGSVENVLSRCNIYKAYNGTYQATVSGHVTNTLNDCVVGRDGSGTNFFHGCCGKVTNVTNTITDSYLAYCRGTSYTTSSYSVTGNITNHFTGVTLGGTCFFTRGSKSTAVVENIIKDSIFGENIIVINGACRSSETRIQGDSKITGQLIAYNSGNGVSTNEIWLEGGTYGQGTAWVAPGKDAPSAPVSRFYLAGDISITSKTEFVYCDLAEEIDAVTLTQTENWSNQNLWFTDAAKNVITVAESATTKGYYSKAYPGCILGGNMDEAVMASINVDERIWMNLWIHTNAVKVYLDRCGAFSMTAKLGDTVLADYDLADLESFASYLNEEGTYFKLPLSATAANRFDDKITVSGSFDEEAFVRAFSVLDNAKSGIEQYVAELTQLEKDLAAAVTAKDEALQTKLSASIAEITKIRDLFIALYNYGASACEVDFHEETLPEGFYVDMADNDPKSYKETNSGIDFTSMELLMGDAIGIRFNGETKEGFDAEKLTMTYQVVEGSEDAQSGYFDIYEDGEGNVKIYVYVSLDTVDKEILFKFYYGEEPALAVQTSIKGYTEWAKGQYSDDMVAALADLAQAVYNYNN